MISIAFKLKRKYLENQNQPKSQPAQTKLLDIGKNAQSKTIKKLRKKMTFNPWQVEGIQAFSYLNCPECSFKTKEEPYFQHHAIQNHPLSFVLFAAEDVKVKVEEGVTNVETFYHFLGIEQGCIAVQFTVLFFK